MTNNNIDFPTFHVRATGTSCPCLHVTMLAAANTNAVKLMPLHTDLLYDVAFGCSNETSIHGL